MSEVLLYPTAIHPQTCGHDFQPSMSFMKGSEILCFPASGFRVQRSLLLISGFVFPIQGFWFSIYSFGLYRGVDVCEFKVEGLGCVFWCMVWGLFLGVNQSRACWPPPFLFRFWRMGFMM